MGLLDFTNNDDARFGINLLAAASPTVRPAGVGERLALAMRMNDEQRQRTLEEQMRKEQIQNAATINQLHKAQVNAAMRDLDKQKWLEETAQQFYRQPQSPASQALDAGAKFGSVGPTQQNALLLPMATGTPGGFDQQGYINAIMQKYPMDALKLQADARKAGQVTLKNGEVVYDANGKRLFGNEQPDLQFVPGDGYQPDRMFNKNSGQVTPAPGTSIPGPSMPGQMAQPGNLTDPNAPWRNMPPKEQDAFRKSIFEQESKKLNDIRAAVSRGRDVLGDLDRFGQLNRDTPTGGLYDKAAPFNWHFGNNENQMVSIQNRLGPMARPAGAGSTSNWEGLQYLSALPGIDKPGPANQAIREDYQHRFDLALKELSFKENYLSKYGHLNGADSAFQASLQNPGAGMGNQTPAMPRPTASGKMLNAQQRAALDIVMKSGDPALIAQARKKGWIE